MQALVHLAFLRMWHFAFLICVMCGCVHSLHSPRHAAQRALPGGRGRAVMMLFLVGAGPAWINPQFLLALQFGSRVRSPGF